MLRQKIPAASSRGADEAHFHARNSAYYGRAHGGRYPGHGQQSSGHRPRDRLWRRLRQAGDRPQSRHRVDLARIGEHARFFSPHGPAPEKGQRQTFATPAGKLTVSITAAPVNIQNVDIKACHFSFTTDVAFAVVGAKSTGRFAQASGPGAIQVYFAGYGPRYASGPKKGQCNTSPSAPELAKGAVASFVLSAVLKA